MTLKRFSYVLISIGLIFFLIIGYFDLLARLSQYRMKGYWSKVISLNSGKWERGNAKSAVGTGSNRPLEKRKERESRRVEAGKVGASEHVRSHPRTQKYLSINKKGPKKNQLGILLIPKIGVVQVVLFDATQQNLALGPCLIKGSAYPGTRGNAVIAGHRVTHGFPFRNIDKLKQNDEIIFENNSGAFVYLIRKKFKVTPRNTSVLKNTPFPQLTLLSCEPPFSARFRLVVLARGTNTSTSAF